MTTLPPQTARSRGWKAIRLDCLKGNDIPVKMYQSYGFIYVDTVDITSHTSHTKNRHIIGSYATLGI